MSNPIEFRRVGRFEQWRRKLYCEVLRRLGFAHIVVRAQGALFVVDTTDLIDRSIAWFGEWESPQLADLARVCRSRAVDYFLDIGANSGFYTVMLATRGLAKEFIAFEPDPGNYAHLLANLHVNGLGGKVACVPCAVGDAATIVTLWQARAENRGESWVAHPDKAPEAAPVLSTHQVRQVRFDDEYSMVGKTIVIKMDVEGSEFHALAGMQRTLQANHGYLQVELYSDRIAELKSVFNGLGYRYVRTRDIDHYFTNIPDIE